MTKNINRKNLAFLYLLVALMVGVSLMAVVFYSEGFFDKINLFYIVVALSLVFFMLVYVMDRYATMKQLTDSWVYVNLMRRNQSSKELVLLIFSLVLLCVVVIFKKILAGFF